MEGDFGLLGVKEHGPVSIHYSPLQWTVNNGE